MVVSKKSSPSSIRGRWWGHCLKGYCRVVVDPARVVGANPPPIAGAGGAKRSVPFDYGRRNQLAAGGGGGAQLESEEM